MRYTEAGRGDGPRSGAIALPQPQKADSGPQGPGGGDLVGSNNIDNFSAFASKSAPTPATPAAAGADPPSGSPPHRHPIAAEQGDTLASMPSIQIHSAPTPALRAGVLALNERCGPRDRLSDHLLADLRSGSGADWESATFGEPTAPQTYAQLSGAGEVALLEVIGERDAERSHQLVSDLLAVSAWRGPIRWWIHGRSDADRPAATRLSFEHERLLLEMGRDLSERIESDLEVRSFIPGVDDEAWLEVNNAAFAAHGEQSGWDGQILEARCREPWFDSDGFLIHESDSGMDGFCWTKIHPDTDPVTGEIYVIGVHPSRRGRGLGRHLTIAGLASMQRAGARRANLFVDEDNTAAVAMYRSLEFEVVASHEAMLRSGDSR